MEGTTLLWHKALYDSKDLGSTVFRSPNGSGCNNLSALLKLVDYSYHRGTGRTSYIYPGLVTTEGQVGLAIYTQA